MPEYLTPGVYVEEVDSGPKPIEGVSTSTAGFLGETERGPTEPKLVTSFGQFERHYGGFDLYAQGERLSSTYLAYGVEGFFRNGGQRCFVGRVEANELPRTSGPLRASEDSGAVPRIDFGTVRLGRKATKSLTLTNDGAGVVEITAVEPSDDEFFTVGDPTVERLEPDDVSTIEVTFAPGSNEDEQNETLTIRTADDEGTLLNDPNHLSIALSGQGGEALATEALHVDFDPTVVSRRSTHPVTLTNFADADAELGDVQGEDETFETTLQSATVGPGATTTLAVEFSPQTATEEGKTLTVPYTVKDVQGQFTIDVTGTGVPGLETDATFVDFAAEDEDAVTVTVTNRSTRDVDIDTAPEQLGAFEDPDADPLETVDAFDVTPPDEPTLEPGETADVTVAFTPAADDSRQTATLRIPYTLDDDPQDPLVVDLHGLGPEANLGSDALRIDFGELPLTGSKTERLVLTNNSGEPLDISTAPAGPFTPSLGTTQLPDTESTTLDVTFDPTTVGAFEQTLELEYTVDETTETLLVELTGSARHAFDVRTSVTVGTIEAVGPGVWGRNVAAMVENGTLHSDDNPVFKLTLRYWSRDVAAEAAREHGPDMGPPQVPEPTHEEVYDNLSIEEGSGNYAINQVNGDSTLVRITREGTASPTDWTVESTWLDATFPTPMPNVSGADYAGSNAVGERTGLAAFEQVDEISLVCAPDQARDTETSSLRGVTADIVSHCEKLGDRFAVLQTPMGTRDIGELRPPIDTSYGAYYFPSIRQLDPLTRVEKEVPVVGHVTGIYARSDSNRGVYKAPANEVVRGAVELSVELTKEEQGLLNPRNVNVVRSFRGRGIRVWGARTMSSDPSWKYVNVRRLFLFLEESIDENTQWTVFEPNSEALWARVRQTVSNFLLSQWREGALAGTTPEEAFFVKCDRSTMTQNDIDNGRLVVLIGVAPVKPVEFVIFRISQKTVESTEA